MKNQSSAVLLSQKINTFLKEKDKIKSGKSQKNKFNPAPGSLAAAAVKLTMFNEKPQGVKATKKETKKNTFGLTPGSIAANAVKQSVANSKK